MLPGDDSGSILSKIESQKAESDVLYTQLRDLVRRYEAEKVQADSAALQYKRQIEELEEQNQKLKRELQVKRDREDALKAALSPIFENLVN
jgi:predicted RNase H-like nuclease (RuvC/YqgF family)